MRLIGLAVILSLTLAPLVAEPVPVGWYPGFEDDDIVKLDSLPPTAPSNIESFRGAANHVDKILRGPSPLTCPSSSP